MSNEGSMTVVPDEVKHRVSYSQYSMWATCPKQWKLGYVDRLRPRDSNIYGVFGTAIHETIQEWLCETVYHPIAPDSLIQSWDLLGRFRHFLKENFTKNIKIQEDGTSQFPCDVTTLQAFFTEGSLILSALKKDYQLYFPIAGIELLGVELSIDFSPAPHIGFIGYLDIVLRHRGTNEIFILDLKTSTKGWKYEKKDQKKLDQLLLYKQFYADRYGLNLADVTVRFMILTRQLQSPTQNRIEIFEPPQTTKIVKKAVEGFNSFVAKTYTPDGSIRLDGLLATPSRNNCRFCPFRERKDLCDQAVID